MCFLIFVFWCWWLNALVNQLLSRVFTKLGGAEDFQVQVLVARLMQNLCVRPQFANALNDPHLGTAKKLARMRDTYNLHAWRHSRSSSTAGNSSKKGKDDASSNIAPTDEPSDTEFAATASEFNVSLSVNFTTNVLLGFKTNAERETVAVQSYSRQPPIHAEVTWDTWGSKIDRMWNPVLTIAPTAQVQEKEATPALVLAFIDANTDLLLNLPFEFVPCNTIEAPLRLFHGMLCLLFSSRLIVFFCLFVVNFTLGHAHARGSVAALSGHQPGRAGHVRQRPQLPGGEQADLGHHHQGQQRIQAQRALPLHAFSRPHGV
jgi:hypothetical protein